MEQWKQIEGKDNAEVSTWGRIRVNGTIKECKQNCRGYRNYANCPVSKHVARAFIPNPEDKPIVDHIDWNRSNDFIKNLRWVTRSENAQNIEAAMKFRPEEYFLKPETLTCILNEDGTLSKELETWADVEREYPIAYKKLRKEAHDKRYAKTEALERIHMSAFDFDGH